MPNVSDQSQTCINQCLYDTAAAGRSFRYLCNALRGSALLSFLFPGNRLAAVLHAWHLALTLDTKGFGR